MSGKTTAGDVPAAVAQNATTPGALDKGEMTLIGLFGPDAALAALVRMPGGDIRQVRTGEKLALDRVVGIDAKGLMLERGGRTRRIVMPGG